MNKSFSLNIYLQKLDASYIKFNETNFREDKYERGISDDRDKFPHKRSLIQGTDLSKTGVHPKKRNTRIDRFNLSIT